MKKITRNRRCAYPDCHDKATGLATGAVVLPSHYLSQNAFPLAWYCAHHRDVVADQGRPEYIVHCPACGCGFGVN